jgi:hypothetical protein
MCCTQPIKHISAKLIEMIKCILILFTATAICSCKNNIQSTIKITLRAKDNIKVDEIKLFQLISIDSAEFFKAKAQHKNPKSFIFRNTKCINSNEFIFDAIDTGAYFGLLEIKQPNGEGTYKISIPTISVKKDTTKVIQEISSASDDLF